MAKILVVANPKSTLTRERGLIGKDSGHEIHWFSVPKIQMEGVFPHGLPDTTAFVRRILGPLEIWKTLRFVDPDLVHVHYAAQGWMTPFLAKRRPLIVTTMGSDILPDKDYQGVHAPLIRRLLESADIITTKSDFMDRAILEIGDFQTKLRRFTWGVDTSVFRPDLDVADLRKQLKISPEDRVFFDVRNVGKLYNRDKVQQAFAEYLALKPPPSVLLCSTQFGSPETIQPLKELAKQLGTADRVRFLDPVPPADMPRYLAIADAIVSIPDSDGLPQTYYEALASGCYIVTDNLPQYEGVVIDGVTGCFCDRNNPRAVADAMFRFATQTASREEAVTLARDYIRRVADKATQRRQLNELYTELLSRGRGK